MAGNTVGSVALGAVRDWANGKFANTPKTTTITLAASDWSNSTCTKSVTGMTSSTIVIVSPTPTSLDAYSLAGVRATNQGSGTLTFRCIVTPTSSLTVDLLMLS